MSVATGSMLFDVVDFLQKKRRLLYVVAFISVDFWLVGFCNQALQNHRSNITARIHNSESSSTQMQYQNGTLDGGNMTAGLEHGIDTVEVGVLRATVAATDGITKAEHALAVAGAATLHAAGNGAFAVAHTTGEVTAVIMRFEVAPYVATVHGAGNVVGAISGLSHVRLASVIQPKKNTAAPIITPEQAQQASLIQKDTLAVKPVKLTGSGGACDSGAGNGAYPMDWCDAQMDTIRTVSYSSDRINRECTSYAFWYFTVVEGHTDFHVTGNANRWATTSNYPTHATPAAGSIAVETGGAYGHVAIVQALPGQTYDGTVVPTGYVLVSEMNYDWQGHFRYSLSPLSKFSAYIYP